MARCFSRQLLAVSAVCAAALGTTPTIAQTTQGGKVATSSAGQVGQRVIREQEVGGLEPLERINTRIQSRVQSRIRNRIDRFYDPQANAVSPFEIAGDQVRKAGRTSRR